MAAIYGGGARIRTGRIRSDSKGLDTLKSGRNGRAGEIYIAQLLPFLPVKIGWSKESKRRTKAINQDVPGRLHHVATFAASIETEQLIHDELAGYCIGNEWYWPSFEFLASMAIAFERRGLGSKQASIRPARGEWSPNCADALPCLSITFHRADLLIKRAESRRASRFAVAAQ